MPALPRCSDPLEIIWLFATQKQAMKRKGPNRVGKVPIRMPIRERGSNLLAPPLRQSCGDKLQRVDAEIHVRTVQERRRYAESTALDRFIYLYT